MSEINLIGGFYKSKTLPWSAQDVVNWVPVKSVAGGTRSPYKLRGLPGLSRISASIVIGGISIIGDAPNSSCGSSYSYQYTTTGGTLPLRFAVTSGALPPGLSLNPDTGRISGAVICGTNIEFGEVENLAAGGGIFISFNTNSSLPLPGTPLTQEIAPGVLTIVVVLNIATTSSTNTATFNAFLDGAVVGTTGEVRLGVDNPTRYFAFDTTTAANFYIQRIAGSGTFTGEIYTYTQSVGTLYPGTTIGTSGGPGVYSFGITATDASGLTSTISDSITISA